MDSYLTKTYNLLHSDKKDNITLILGNESCDLDSAVSALVYAAYLNWQYEQIQCKVCTRKYKNEVEGKEDVFLPIINVHREDFDLKTEVVYAFNEVGVDRSKLVFRNDYDMKTMTQSKNLSVVLVDHHILSKNDEFLAPYVREVIDHRPLDSQKWCYRNDTRTKIELVGSCCTLITERIRDLSALVAGVDDFFNVFPATCKLLHSTIILDTVNFSKDVDKGTPKDEEMVSYLERLMKIEDPVEYRKNRLKQLEKARSDVSSLTAAQLLKKDVKVFRYVLVPSFPILIENLLKVSGLQEALEDTLKKHDCKIALLLGMDLNGSDVSRDVTVYAPESSQGLRDELIDTLLQWDKPVFKLVQENKEELPNSRYFRQLNKSASRKQFVPAVNSFLEKLG